MARSTKAYVCARCVRPIHAAAASAASISPCTCPAPRKIIMAVVNPAAVRHPIRQCVGLGTLAIAALLARRSTPTIQPARLDAALTRVKPLLDDPTAYADLLVRKCVKV